MTPDEIDEFCLRLRGEGYAVCIIAPEDVVLGTVTDGIVNEERLAIAKPWLTDNIDSIEESMTTVAFECILDGYLQFPA